MDKDNFIELKEVSFHYGKRPVLEKVNLSLRKNGFYLFVGPNGGGKTTLLKLIMGLYRPTQGTVLINGKAPKECRCQIGYAPQTLQFDPLFPLSVLEFVKMGSLSHLSWCGTWPKPVTERAKEILEFVNLGELQNQAIGGLSGGQLQRASLARALIDDPDILILDEPTTGLDPGATKMIQEKIRQFVKKKTILFVTHSSPEIIEDIDEMICVDVKIEKMEPASICDHHMYGIYHQQGEGENS